MTGVTVVRVFAAAAGGGNPAPIAVDADGLSDEEMRAVAARYGLESGFVLSSADAPGHDLRMRFWVPEHEMEMCGHATVGAVWLLDRLGRLSSDDVTIATRSGTVRARLGDDDGSGRTVMVSQPVGRVTPVADPSPVLDVLGLDARDVAGPVVLNAATSRTKTLVPVADTATLDGLRPRFEQMASVCDQIGSTGLYPYVVVDDDALRVDARQFPRSSGYPEDAATGIAATALAFGLLTLGVARTDSVVRVRQGRAMGRPSEIVVRFNSTDGAVDGCWLSGSVLLASPAPIPTP